MYLQKIRTLIEEHLAMELLKETAYVEKKGCLIAISEKEEGHVQICKIEAVGKHQWTHLFPSVYGGYAMLLEKHLFDLPGETFLVYQINEHSRGAHHEYELQLLNLEGKVLGGFSGRYYSDFILDQKYVWFLTSGKEPYSLGSNRDLNLVQLHIKTGRIKQNIKLNYANLLACSTPMVFRVKLIEKNSNGFIEIVYSNRSTGENNIKRRMPLSQFS